MEESLALLQQVFPAQAGMNRRGTRREGRIPGVPRTGGDEPALRVPCHVYD